MNIVYNDDCIKAMKLMQNNEFDLAIVDPPYGIGWTWKNPGRLSISNHKKKSWNDKIPPPRYFRELFRISKNQIIWGGNYFTKQLPPMRGWIVWNKFTQKSVYSDVELAWTSFDKTAKLFEYQWNGMLQGHKGNKALNEIRIHPTQKPVVLYEWLLTNYASNGDRILDTHLGSGSSRIAAYNLGFSFTGYELDNEYFLAQEARYKTHTNQLRLY